MNLGEGPRVGVPNIGSAARRLSRKFMVPTRDRMGLFGSIYAIESKWSTGRSCIDYLEFKGAGNAIG